MRKVRAPLGGFQKLFTIALLMMIVAMAWSAYEVKAAFLGDADTAARIEIIPEYRLVAGEDGVLWRKGESIPEGNAAYFLSSRPVMTVSPVVKASGLTSGEIEGSIQAIVMLESVDETGRPYWSDKIGDRSKEIFTILPESSEYAMEPIVLDLVDIAERGKVIQRDLDFRQGTLRLSIVFESAISGNVNGTAVSDEFDIPFPIVLKGVSFDVPQMKDAIHTVNVETFRFPALDSVRLNEELQRKPYLVIADGLLLLVVIILTFLDILKKRKNRMTPDQKKFKQWITEGSVDPKDQMCIDIHSLEGLVDLAIELEKRVIHDTKKGKYFVIAEGMIYDHDPKMAKALLDNRPQLGKLLIDKGLIRQEQLETSLYHQQRMGIRLGESLIALGFVDECSLHSILASQQGLDYVELDPAVVNHVGDWLGWISLKEAKAMHILPLGRRNDGRLVVACGDPTMEGVKKAISEMFGSNTILVVSRPSLIREGIERLENKDRIAGRMANIEDINKMPHERISAEEHEDFKSAYANGELQVTTLLKAAGMVDPLLLEGIPSQEETCGWLVSKNMLPCEMSNIIKGLEKAINDAERKGRDAGTLPAVIDVLEDAFYLSENTVGWITKEHHNSSLTMEEFLYVNHLASERTIKNVRMLLKVVEELLNSQRQ